LALEAALGGLCDELKVSLIRDRVFSFTFSSKQIGFRIQQRDHIPVVNLNAFFIYGVGVARIGCVSLISGSLSATRNRH
jgi:hypothetical protein